MSGLPSLQEDQQAHVMCYDTWRHAILHKILWTQKAVHFVAHRQSLPVQHVPCHILPEQSVLRKYMLNSTPCRLCEAYAAVIVISALSKVCGPGNTFCKHHLGSSGALPCCGHHSQLTSGWGRPCGPYTSAASGCMHSVEPACGVVAPAEERFEAAPPLQKAPQTALTPSSFLSLACRLARSASMMATWRNDTALQ